MAVAMPIQFDDELDKPAINIGVRTCRLNMRGLPMSTTMEEAFAVKEVFSVFGKMEVESICNGYASLLFETPQGALRAMCASGRVCYKGYYLTVSEQDIPNKNFEYMKNSNDDLTVDPTYVKFDGNVLHQFLSLRNTICFANKDVMAFPQIAVDLENVMRMGWPGTFYFAFFDPVYSVMCLPSRKATFQVFV
ncbi:uncharacterized protein LOC119835595 isoform X2 [Zerene cesonia]|uniref:uncharacterized protein LOC119835595 isoform X2 n=1 Tax=Zerene cesonia TaxID=33412 RepID=UPI0018E4DD92|nr:uncharacterized protein LOC119835595 isoform X2 [Zerene cesonia]